MALEQFKLDGQVATDSRAASDIMPGSMEKREEPTFPESASCGNGSMETTARPEWADESADGVRLMSSLSEAAPVAVAREVIPFRERKR